MFSQLVLALWQKRWSHTQMKGFGRDAEACNYAEWSRFPCSTFHGHVKDSECRMGSGYRCSQQLALHYLEKQLHKPYKRYQQNLNKPKKDAGVRTPGSLVSEYLAPDTLCVYIGIGMWGKKSLTHTPLLLWPMESRRWTQYSICMCFCVFEWLWCCIYLSNTFCILTQSDDFGST